MRTSAKNRKYLERYSCGRYHNNRGGYLDVDIQIAFAEEVVKILQAAKIDKITFICKGNSSHTLTASTCMVCRGENIKADMINVEHLGGVKPPKGMIWLLDDCIAEGRTFQRCQQTMQHRWNKIVDRVIVIESTEEYGEGEWPLMGLHCLTILKNVIT